MTFAQESESLPSRGAWIEIQVPAISHGRIIGRSPHGERGLKSIADAGTAAPARSLPSRGAWIEITIDEQTGLIEQKSLPPRGAWIEIGLVIIAVHSSTRRSSHGERGLKCKNDGAVDAVAESLPPRGAWIEILRYEERRLGIQVAPPTGSVD